MIKATTRSYGVRLDGRYGVTGEMTFRYNFEGFAELAGNLAARHEMNPREYSSVTVEGYAAEALEILKGIGGGTVPAGIVFRATR